MILTENTNWYSFNILIYITHFICHEKRLLGIKFLPAILHLVEVLSGLQLLNVYSILQKYCFDNEQNPPGDCQSNVKE